MDSELIRIEPLVRECPECQEPITRSEKRGRPGPELMKAQNQLRAVAARNCKRCDGKMVVLTPAGERVRTALLPLIDYCVRVEVVKQLRELGFAAPMEALVGAPICADQGGA